MNAVEIAGPEVSVDAGRRSRRASDVVLAVEGTFDLAAAMRAAASALGQAPRTRVMVDLRRARIEDVALAAFVRAVAGRPIAIVGLSRHHERLLRYLDGDGGTREAEER